MDVDLICYSSGYVPLLSCYEHCNASSGSIKDGGFLGKLSVLWVSSEGLSSVELVVTEIRNFQNHVNPLFLREVRIELLPSWHPPGVNVAFRTSIHVVTVRVGSL
jgi:hypothetical protein